MTNKKEAAAEKLINYFSAIYQAAGLGWNESRSQEIHQLINTLVGAAVEETNAIRQHRDILALRQYQKQNSKIPTLKKPSPPPGRSWTDNN